MSEPTPNSDEAGEKPHRAGPFPFVDRVTRLTFDYLKWMAVGGGIFYFGQRNNILIAKVVGLFSLGLLLVWTQLAAIEWGVRDEVLRQRGAPIRRLRSAARIIFACLLTAVVVVMAQELMKAQGGSH